MFNMLWFKFTSSSNFFKMVHIFLTSLYFSNKFIFIKLVHIFQTGLKFLTSLIFNFELNVSVRLWVKHSS